MNSKGNLRGGRHDVCPTCRGTGHVQRAKSATRAVDSKLCSECGPRVGPLPLRAFYKNKARKDGRQSRCKKCDNANRAARMNGLGGERGPRVNADSGCTVCGSRWHEAVFHEMQRVAR